MKRLLNLFRHPAVQKIWPYLWLLVLLVSSFLFKTLPIYNIVFADKERAQYMDTDSYFYLRHTMASAKHFPALQKFDFATHYPRGMDADVASFFPWTTALGLKLFGITDHGTAERVLAWLMPVLSGFILILLFLWGKLYGQVWLGLLAGTLWVLLPGFSLGRTILGSFDHHILEMILGLACAYQYDVLLVRSKELSWRTNWWRGWPLAALFLCWPGAPLFLLICGLAFMAWTIYQVGRINPDVHQAALSGSFFGGAIFMLLIIRIFYPAWITGIDSLTFNMCLLAMAVGAVLPWLLLSQIERLPQSVRKALPVSLGVIITLGLGWFVTSTEIGQEMWMRLQYQGDGINENAKLTLSQILDSQGYMLFATAVGALFLLLSSLKRTNKTKYWFPLYFSVFLILFWTNTFDLDYQLNIFSAWILALAVGQGVYLLKSQPRTSANKKNKAPSAIKPWVSAVPLAILTVIAGLSMWRVTGHGSFLASKSLFTKSIMHKPPLAEALTWIKEHTPAEPIAVDSIIHFSGRDYTYPPGAYGIMSAWDYGNSIIYEGERYAAWSRFPSNFVAQWIFAPSEDEAMAILNKRCKPPESFRYVLIDAPMVSTMTQALADEAKVNMILETRAFSTQEGQNYEASVLGQPYQQSMGARLYRTSGNGLHHHRLVYESSQWSVIYHQDVDGLINLNTRDAGSVRQARASELRVIQGQAYYDQLIQPTVKLFELVAGARINGQTTPGQSIRLTLRLSSRLAQRELIYSQESIADANGRYTFTVPYATEANSGHTVQSLGAYELKIMTKERADIKSVQVTEQDIQRGHTINIF